MPPDTKPVNPPEGGGGGGGSALVVEGGCPVVGDVVVGGNPVVVVGDVVVGGNPVVVVVGDVVVGGNPVVVVGDVGVDGPGGAAPAVHDEVIASTSSAGSDRARVTSMITLPPCSCSGHACGGSQKRTTAETYGLTGSLPTVLSGPYSGCANCRVSDTWLNRFARIPTPVDISDDAEASPVRLQIWP